MQLAFGLSRVVPEEVETAWGARLIEPADLLHDRQDLVAENDEAKQELIAWLNGSPSGNGAIKGMREHLMKEARLPQDRNTFTLYEDADGVIVGSTNGSYGYVYCAGWLKPDRDRTRYVLKRGPIPADRWERAYGWSREEAEKMNGTSSEVRLFRVDANGERELSEGADGGYEFGYGGTGPHVSAAAIVQDILGENPEMSPASYRRLVPEVFGAGGSHDDVTVVVRAADVQARLATA
jgi:hypothetical protein